jgi:hypothetical protein
LDLATMAGAGEVLAEIEDVSPPPTIGGAVPNSQHDERASPLCGSWTGAWLAVVSLLAVAVYWLIKDSLIDDSYITLGYAQQFGGALSLGPHSPGDGELGDLAAKCVVAGRADGLVANFWRCP